MLLRMLLFSATIVGLYLLLKWRTLILLLLTTIYLLRLRHRQRRHQLHIFCRWTYYFMRLLLLCLLLCLLLQLLLLMS